MPGNFQDIFSQIPVITYLANLSCTSYFFSLAKPNQIKKSPLQNKNKNKKPLPEIERSSFSFILLVKKVTQTKFDFSKSEWVKLDIKSNLFFVFIVRVGLFSLHCPSWNHSFLICLYSGLFKYNFEAGKDAWELQVSLGCCLSKHKKQIHVLINYYNSHLSMSWLNAFIFI